MILRTFDSRVAFVAASTAFIASRAYEAIARRGRFRLALSGGSTPRPVYEALAESAGFPWALTQLYFGDERCVPPDDERSNHRMVRLALLDRLAEPPAAVARMRGEADPQDAARDYEDLLRRDFSLAPGELPAFDLALLGMGPDGHTASLFPGSPLLAERERLVAVAQAPGVSPRVARITLTLPALNAAQSVLFLVSGMDKLALVKAIQQGRPQAAPLPAAMVRPQGECVWHALLE